jgi:DNA polymerase
MGVAQLSLSTDGKGTAAELLPDRLSLKALREAAAGCKACPLWEGGTQTVFGEGAKGSEVVFVGEQPGDREDREGRPFVGPAGGLLDKALERAEIDRDDVYVTNVVKHFKWKPGRGKRRIHQTPSVEEVRACVPWLEAELTVIKPRVLVCLGATAAKRLIAPSFRVTVDRGEFRETHFSPHTMGTVHPSSILRIDDDPERRMAMDELVDDLLVVKHAIEGRDVAPRAAPA